MSELALLTDLDPQMMPDLVASNNSGDLFFDSDQNHTSFLNSISDPNFTSGVAKDVKDIPQTKTRDGPLHTRHDTSSPNLPNKSPYPVLAKLQSPISPKRQDFDDSCGMKSCEPFPEEQQQDQTASRRANSAQPPSSPKTPVHRRSAPEIGTSPDDVPASTFPPERDSPRVALSKGLINKRPINGNPPLPDITSPLESPRSSLDDERLSRHSDTFSDGLNDPAFWRELDSRWILNLSMAFRENSEREKFFITYAEQPNHWRRVTVSVDYSKKPPDSLEADLKTLPFQRDKSAHIYEAIHKSLASVQFYDTVTNLKLETSDGRLHVHVTEDVNEIIKYPPISAISHLNLPQPLTVLERDLHFQAHLSGFVYRVSFQGQSYIKKEIPGPDMIDEFLYEVNALWNLKDSRHVIDFCAIVLDEQQQFIKGLLISYAECGTLVDVIYDNRDPPLPWEKRDKWAKQIVAGLADIHEHGFVQGDFTLSNIVIDGNDNAQIIDINRRGCPVGWEPPEFQGLIESSQRISMYIGTKSDLYQLGMVLWGLAALDDEPDRALDDLTLEGKDYGAPEYLVKWVKSCLSEEPRFRLSAKDLLHNPTEVDKIQISPSLPMQDIAPPPPMPIQFAQFNSSPASNPADDTFGYSQDLSTTHVEPQTEEWAPEPTNGERTRDMPRQKTQPGATTERPSKRALFSPPLHQDSGLGGVEIEAEPRLNPPTHQDSGFNEDYFENVLGAPKTESRSSFPRRRGGPMDLAGTGGQFG